MCLTSSSQQGQHGAKARRSPICGQYTRSTTIPRQILLTTPRGRTTVVSTDQQKATELVHNGRGSNINDVNDIQSSHIQNVLYQAARRVDVGEEKRAAQEEHFGNCHCQKFPNTSIIPSHCRIQWWHQGRSISPNELKDLIYGDVGSSDHCVYLSMKLPIVGGMDRQNRVGSKFGGGGVSSSQQSERERKERLKQLALESIDLAKDPYLMRNHLGTYECKLCLTLHTNEANYLAHTQGKKHQQGLARRAYMEKLRAEKEGRDGGGAGPALGPRSATGTKSSLMEPPRKKVRIGRPAYQVFKSRDVDNDNQRCLSFELSYPEIGQGDVGNGGDDENGTSTQNDLQPRHRFMSAFEQKIESPPDRRYQYLLFAAEPYETVAFKIPNEPIDKRQDRFVTHWDPEEKKFTLTLYFLQPPPLPAAPVTEKEQI